MKPSTASNRMLAVENATTVVRCLHIPITNGYLLLPNTAVAEVASLDEIRELTVDGERPGWLLGGLLWRTLLVPLVNYEALLGLPVPTEITGSRIAVLNSISGKPGLPFFAVISQGIPRLIRVDEDHITSRDEPAIALVKANVLVNGEAGLIPDLDALERRLRELGLGVKFEREKLSLK